MCLMFRLNRFKPFLLTCLSFWLVACHSESGTEKDQPLNQEKIKQQFVKANQQLVVKENDEMDYYQKSHQMPFVKTKSGIRYFVYKTSAKGDSIKNGDIIKIEYTVSLLDGTICYSSKNDGAKKITVGMEDVEDGLHKALTYFKSGDKARILIPSHLAHGLLGDTKKIPPQSPIMYDIDIISIIKNRH